MMNATDFFNIEKNIEDIIVEEDITGLIEISLESEMIWNTLKNKVINEEIENLLFEETNSSDSKKSDMGAAARAKGEQATASIIKFFMKAEEFFKKLFTKISLLMRKIIQKIQIKAIDGVGFYKRNKEKLDKLIQMPMNIENVKIYEWKKTPDTLNLIEADPSKLMGGSASQTLREGNPVTLNELSLGLYKAEFPNISPTLVSQCRRTIKEETEVTPSLFTDSITVISKFKDNVKRLNGQSDGIKKLTSKAILASRKGISAAKKDDKKEIIYQKAVIGTCRNLNMVANRGLNTYIKLILESYSDAMIVIKATLASEKSQNKTEKSGKKKKK